MRLLGVDSHSKQPLWNGNCFNIYFSKNGNGLEKNYINVYTYDKYFPKSMTHIMRVLSRITFLRKTCRLNLVSDCIYFFSFGLMVRILARICGDSGQK